MTFRNLTADEVECRVSTVSEKGVSLLLYKDARCDMRILDEVIGAENWQREHYECKGNLFCRVGLRSNGEWVWKSDCGAESYTEKEKGEASDSFKRACFNWGIGRELYTSPFIWVKADNVRLSQLNGKWTTKDRFRCDVLKVENGKIIGLVITNVSKNCSAFEWGDTSTKDYFCSVCKKYVPAHIAEKSLQANGKVYCSGTCKKKDTLTGGKNESKNQ